MRITRSVHRRTLQIEALDPRYAFDATGSSSAGLPWFDVGGLTYSFAPDGTGIGSHQSSLFQELSSTGSPDQWQAEFARALEDWLGSLGAQASQVDDSGAPFGTFGKTQGDLRFGDIRVGAIPLAGNVMAEAIPHAIVTQGSWAGDILLNANADWHDLQEVYSVALHELGHVLGLGHSSDPNSPMYSHGLYFTNGPTTSDLQDLKKLYAGVSIEADDSTISEPADYEWNEVPEFPFDPTSAIPLQATLGLNARYSAQGSLTATQPNLIYRLDPFGEIDNVKFLNIAVSADQFGGLFPQIRFYDHQGEKLPFRILHYSTGVEVVQVSDVEPNETYYVSISPANTALIHQVGGFELFAEFTKTQLLPTKSGILNLTPQYPIYEQPFTVNTSRLVHVLLESNSKYVPSAVSAIWASLVDSHGNILSQLGMNKGETRSLPITLLEAGDYRVIVQAGTSDGSNVSVQQLTMSIDEISIDVGPGIINPAIEPILPCGSLGANPNKCTPAKPVVLNSPIYPNPQSLPSSPVYPSIAPFNVPSWYFWPNSSYHQNPIMPLDVSGDSQITPVDALLIINALNGKTVKWDHAYDCNGDSWITPIDALLVINKLNSMAQGEGESSSDPTKPKLSGLESKGRNSSTQVVAKDGLRGAASHR